MNLDAAIGIEFEAGVFTHRILVLLVGDEEAVLEVVERERPEAIGGRQPSDLEPKHRAQALRYRFHVGTAEFADRSYYP